MRALVISDGEHYAPVVRDAVTALPYEVVALWLAGGSEIRGGWFTLKIADASGESLKPAAKALARSVVLATKLSAVPE